MILTISGAVEPKLSENARAAFLEIKRTAERAASLTRQLLLFSRRQVMQPRTLDLNEMVTDLTKMLRRILGEDIQLQLNLSTKPLWTCADAGMLDQVLLNLSVNARDAMPTGGRLTIETGERVLSPDDAPRDPDVAPGPYVRLSVADTGCGISAEVLPRIFEPFFTTKEAGKGTGLGLATVFGIVKQHRGWVEVHSEPGQGAAFHVLLPASTHGADALGAAQAKPRPKRGDATILLVEDESSVRSVMRVALERHGYRVIEAAHGREALALEGQHGDQIQLLITDLVMPEGMDGRHLAEKLQTRRPHLKIIFMTGYSRDLAGRELTLQRGQGFIQKPFTIDELFEVVQRCLEGGESTGR
jgi:CheY-like chemotaxis protein